MSAILLKRSRLRGEEKQGDTSKKSSVALQIHIFNFVYGALLFAGAASAFTRFRSPRSNLPSTALVQFQQSPCFAAMSMRRSVRLSFHHSPSESPEHSSRQPPSYLADVTASASNKPDIGPFWTKIKKQDNLIRSKILCDENWFRENTKKRWKVSASQNQPSVQTLPQQQSLTTQKSLTQKLYETIALRRKKWFKGGKILTEQSPEIQNFRTELNVQNKALPNNTSLCFHVDKTKTKQGKKVTMLTTQGTLANYNVQKDILKWAGKYFVIDDQKVVIGDSHESDHYLFSILADVSNLRHSVRSQDRGLTIKLPKRIHKLRTHNPELKKLTFDLEKLTQPLSSVLKPIQDANIALWTMPEHQEAILDAGVTQEFLVKQYNLAHKHELNRMTCDLLEKKLHPKQATAFLVDEMLESSIKLSMDKFIFYEPTPPKLKDESVLWKLKPFEVEMANRCYFNRFRLEDLGKMTHQFAQYTKLAHVLELYSQSPEGLDDGCSIYQTRQHRKTKMKAIHGLEEVLQEGKISERETQIALEDMLCQSNVDKNGNSKEGPLSIEEVKGRISTIGEDLKINSLYHRNSVFSFTTLPAEETRNFYKDCVESAAIKTRNASILPEQASSDQDYTFL
jgi:hypothetical protein